MGPIGVQEMIAIFVIALVLFGPKKLPALGRMLGKGLSEFRRAKSELKATFETHLAELERETRASDPSLNTSVLPAANYSAPQYSYPYEDQGTWETGNSSEVVPASNGVQNASLESGTVHAIEPPAAPAVAPASPVAGAIPRGNATVSEEHPA
jgi:TatA/E family protein of Tat protein translocase